MITAYSRAVMVTGGAGLLGTRLARLLRSDGHRVVILDDGSGGTKQRLRRLEAVPGLRVHRVDLGNRPAVAALCRQVSPKALVHLAGRHFIPYCEANPEETWRVNVDGTRNLLDALAPNPPDSVVFASTADVYSESPLPHREDDPLEPATAYGRSKLAAEQLLQLAGEAWGATTVIARLFNLYGPHHTVDHLIPAVVTQAVAEDRLHLGDLTTIRDFVHVDDAAAALASLLDRRVAGVFNVGTGTPTSGEELVQLVGKLLSRDLEVVLDPQRLRRFNRHALVADPSKLSALLRWWPVTPLDIGLQGIIDAAGTTTSSPRPTRRRDRDDLGGHQVSG